MSKTVFALGLALLGGCAVHPGHQVLSKLYFGLSYAGGSVSETDFDRFLDTCVTPRFPAGFTRYDTEGRWRGAAGETVREKSAVVEIVHVSGRKEEASIQQIIDLYKRSFSQESVLLVEESPQVKF